MDRIREHRSELLDSIQEFVRVIDIEEAESTERVSGLSSCELILAL